MKIIDNLCLWFLAIGKLILNEDSFCFEGRHLVDKQPQATFKSCVFQFLGGYCGGVYTPCTVNNYNAVNIQGCLSISLRVGKMAPGPVDVHVVYW